MQKKKNLKNVLIACGLIACAGVAGISAYFTATDVATNQLEVQNIDVELTEPNFDDLTDVEKQVTPKKTIVKDPQVTNTGTADQFVYLEVTIPTKNIHTAQEDGTKNANAAVTELFTTNTANAKGVVNAAAGAKGLAVNAGWTLVGEPVVGTDNVVYTYAYTEGGAMKALAPNATTPTLFDSITMCNAVESQDLAGTTVEIPVRVKAIQTSGLTAENTTDPVKVLAVYDKQNN